ncbi:hypothetical protein [Nonomuraea candida]|uniref:hypothetical protein n=1 Tax=Nonomuraea candida TaxID=359159 RepID=UPI0005BAC94E|nr:hypothetical protein [Nonomuraea candida]
MGTPGPRARARTTPNRPVPGNPAPPQAVSAWRNSYLPSLGDKALDVLKRAGKLAAGLSPAIAVAGGMLANEPGMASAASVLDSGMSSRLDDGIKQLLPQLLNAAREGWIAMDRDEFERWIWQFHREIGALRNVISKGGGMLDEVAASYRSFWTWVLRMGFAALGLIVVAKGLQRVPNTSVWGLLLERYITAEVNIATLFLATSVATTLKEGGDVLSTMVKKHHQFGYITPGGDAAIDFKSVTIDADAFPSYAEPNPGTGLPPGYQGFDWIAMKRTITPADPGPGSGSPSGPGAGTGPGSGPGYGSGAARGAGPGAGP